jgi:adenine-specific DNA methylase
MGLVAIEVDPAAAMQAKDALAPYGLSAAVREGDFFAYAESLPAGAEFDAILGNPPFLRFQHFRDEHREPAFRLMRCAGLHPTRLTNAWVPFLVASTALLSDIGRLAMVVPAELLQVGYAAELRRFLSDAFARVTVIAFDSLVFEGIQQEVVLLLAEKASESQPGIRVIEVRDAAALSGVDPSHDSPLKEMDHSSEKWTQYFLHPDELQALRAVRQTKGFISLGTVASVDVGVVTGNNDFFLIATHGELDHSRFAVYLEPILTRSRQVRGLEFTPEDWADSRRQGDARHLLAIGPEDGIAPELDAYLQTGIDAGVPLGYKCRVRKKWYVVPSVSRAQGFMLRQIHSHPQMAINSTEATSTDTVHRVAFRGGTDPRGLAVSFHNSATFAFAEVMGRSYGGGVLELEPSEADALPIPYIAALGDLLPSVDRALRVGAVEAALSMVDEAVAQQLGVSPDEFALLRRGWLRLRARRHRRHGPALPRAGKL